MRKMGFCDEWVNAVMRCVSSVQFSVLQNGQPEKNFKPTKGLRQGDPCPYTFFLLLAKCSPNSLKWLLTLGCWMAFNLV